MQMQMFYFYILLILISIYTNYAVRISDRSHLEKCKTTQERKVDTREEEC